jgi:hypothetical protein
LRNPFPKTGGGKEGVNLPPSTFARRPFVTQNHWWALDRRNSFAWELEDFTLARSVKVQMTQPAPVGLKRSRWPPGPDRFFSMWPRGQNRAENDQTSKKERVHFIACAHHFVKPHRQSPARRQGFKEEGDESPRRSLRAIAQRERGTKRLLLPAEGLPNQMEWSRAFTSHHFRAFTFIRFYRPRSHTDIGLCRGSWKYNFTSNACLDIPDVGERWRRSVVRIIEGAI